MISFQIKLNDIERECLSRISGFRVQLPYLLPRMFEGVHKWVGGEDQSFEIVPSSKEYLELKRIIEQRRSQIQEEQDTILTRYPKVEDLDPMKRLDKFWAQFSEEDLRR